MAAIGSGDGFLDRSTDPSTVDLVLGVATILLVLEAARRSGLNPDVVLASSDKAYGDQRGGAYSEETPLRPEHPYDVSKACADMIGRAYTVTYGLPVCVTRCGNFFGGPASFAK